MSGISVAAVLALIDAFIAVLPKLIEAGVNIANVIEKIEAVWTEANLSPDDPRWAEVRASIDANLAKLKKRAEELGA